MSPIELNNDRNFLDALLSAIDNDDLMHAIFAIEKGKININTPYNIPSTEPWSAHKPVFETFLHRAFHKNAKDIFPYLLKEGANPRIKNHRNKTVIEEIVEEALVWSHLSEKRSTNCAQQLVKYADVTSRDFLEAILNSSTLWWDERTNHFELREIVDFANNHDNRQKIKVGEKQKPLPSSAESEHTRN